MRSIAHLFILISLAFLCAGQAYAQTLQEFTGAPGELTKVFYIHEEDSSALHFSNSAMLRGLLLGDESITNRDVWMPRMQLLPIVSASSYNSNRAWGPNSGPVWMGRGATQAFSGGLALQWMVLDVQLRPVYSSTQNRDFRTADTFLEGTYRTRFYSPYRSFDNPERIDTVAVSRMSLGDSWVKLSVGPLSAGVSNQNLWWGPGRRHTIFMTNDAPGFHHATLHTNRPIDLWLARLQFQYMAGRLERAEYNPIEFNKDWRFLTALVVDVEPRWLPGLHLGLVRAFHLRKQDIKSNKDYFPLFQPFQKSKLAEGETPLRDGSAPDDQRASVYFSWNFPDAGFAFYGEFGRTDHASDIRDILLQPHHARAYMIGMHKVFRPEVRPEAIWSISAEITDISNTTPSRVRLWRADQPPYDLYFYTHGRLGGYSHLGRSLGSSYGLGSTGWFFAAQRMGPGFEAGFMADYIRRNRASYLAMQALNVEARQELELVTGIYAKKDVLNGVNLRLSLNRVASKNRYYVPDLSLDETLPPAYFNPVNWNVQVMLTFRPW